MDTARGRTRSCGDDAHGPRGNRPTSRRPTSRRDSRERRTADLAAALDAALASADTYGATGPVTVCETHASRVYLVGDRAYKVKKPVAFGFLDYRSLERRRAACHEELSVNRELAPDIYLAVVALVEQGQRIRLAPENAPAALEYAIEMRRFDEDQTLSGAISTHNVGRADIEAVARRLVRFHDHSPVVTGGGPEELLERWRTNVAELVTLRAPSRRRCRSLARLRRGVPQGARRRDPPARPRRPRTRLSRGPALRARAAWRAGKDRRPDRVRPRPAPDRYGLRSRVPSDGSRSASQTSSGRPTRQRIPTCRRQPRVGGPACFLRRPLGPRAGEGRADPRGGNERERCAQSSPPCAAVAAGRAPLLARSKAARNHRVRAARERQVDTRECPGTTLGLRAPVLRCPA